MTRNHWRTCLAVIATLAIASFAFPSVIDHPSSLFHVAASVTIGLISVGIAYVAADFSMQAGAWVASAWQSAHVKALLHRYTIDLRTVFRAYKTRRSGDRPALSPSWRRCASVS